VYIHITALGINALALLMLMSITGAAPFADVQNSSSNNVFVLNKSDEAIKTDDKAIEINPKYSDTENNKGHT
jgi:hypothetical protein